MNEQTRWASHTYKLVAVLLISFSLYTAAFGVFPDVIQRGMHLALAIILVYLGIITSNRTLLSTLLLIILAIFGASTALYQTMFYDDVVNRYGAMTNPEIWIAAVSVVILLDATRRTIGWSMVVLALIFLAYAFWGNYLWGDIAHRGYGLKRVLSQVYLGADGPFSSRISNVSSAS